MNVRGTERDRLLARRAELAGAQERLTREAEETRWRAAEALAQSRPAPVPQRDYDLELGRLTAALAEVETRLKDPAVIEEHVAARRAAIEQERRSLEVELAPVGRALEKARNALAAAEERAREVAGRQRGRREQLAREEDALRELELALPEPPRPNADPRQVAAHLKEFRARGLGCVIAGQDASLDEAVALYEVEVRELRAWRQKADLAASETGHRVPPPACARHYSRARLKEVCRPSLALGRTGEVSRTGRWRARI